MSNGCIGAILSVSSDEIISISGLSGQHGLSGLLKSQTVWQGGVIVSRVRWRHV